MVLFPQNINLRQSSRWRCSWCFAAAYCTISSALLQLSLSQRLDLPVPIETLAEFEATLCQQVVVLFQVLAAEINFGCKAQVPLPHPPAPPVHPEGGGGGWMLTISIAQQPLQDSEENFHSLCGGAGRPNSWLEWNQIAQPCAFSRAGEHIYCECADEWADCGNFTRDAH